MTEKKSKISNVEWGLFIGALIMIDITQAVLEWLTLGASSITVNPFVDLFLTMAIPFYLHLRGENMADPKRWGGLLLSFLGELIPGVDEFPLWSLYGLYLFSLSKSGEILEKIPGGKATPSIVEKK